MFTNLVLVLLDNNNKHIEVKNVSFNSFDRFKYSNYCKEKSLIIACNNGTISKNIKNSIDAICSSDIKQEVSELYYNTNSLVRINELIELFKRYVLSFSVHSLDSIKYHENSKNDIIYYSINFFTVYNEVLEQLDSVIESGAYFEKVNKKAIKSVIHGRTIKILDQIKFPWVYNENGNVIIDYSKIIEWRSIGVFPTQRRLVELKYFL